MSIHPIERMNLALSAGVVASSLVLSTPAFAASVAVGAALEAFNFRGLHRAAQFLFWGEIRSAGSWAGVYALRFGVLVIGVGATVYFGADPVGLLIGLSLIMPAAVIEAWRARPPVDPEASGIDPEDPEWDRWNPWLAREIEEEDADQ